MKTLIALLAAALAGSSGHAGERPLKFLFMADHHVESDWVQSFGAEKGTPVYTCWQPGDHAALTETYRFIGEDPYCRDANFALFGGDQINTGYLSHAADLKAEMANYYRTLESLDLYRKTKGADVSDLKFSTVPSFVCRGNLARGQSPVTFECRPPDSRVIAIQGNHDTGVGDFYRECAFTAGGVRFITFFASYVGLPSPRKGVYVSTAKISDRAIDFIEKEMAAAARDPEIRHIVLVSHWAIADKGRNFSCPIIGACKENGMSRNRDRLLALCDQYGCDLYINGHEHNGRFPVGTVGRLHDVNCGTPVAAPASADAKDPESGGAFTMVEIHDDYALFHVYSRATVKEVEGKVVVDRRPRRLFTRTIPLTPLRRAVNGDDASRPCLIVNDDNDYFYKQRDDSWFTEAGLVRYFDNLAAGRALTHYFVCVNGQRTSYASKVWEPIWLGLNDPNSQGQTNDIWCVNAKKVHDRGLDPYATWIRRAREKGVSPWISMRMNDTHFASLEHCFRNESRFYDPQYARLKRDPGGKGWDARAWDFVHPEVREHALALVREIFDRWDPDGLELDWLRFCAHLTPGRERSLSHVLTDFTREVRRLADAAGARRGHRIALAMRVPTCVEAALDMGLDAEAIARAGLVDMVVPANFYTTADFDWDLDDWRTRITKANPAVKVVPGVCNMLCAGRTKEFDISCDPAFLRAWASLYGCTGEGVYLFNAQYHQGLAKDWWKTGGLRPDRLGEESRRYPVTYHDIGKRTDMQLPVDLSTTRTFRIRARRLGGEQSARVVLGFSAPVDELPAVAVNGGAAQSPTVAPLGRRYLPDNVKQAVEIAFPISALKDGVNMVTVQPTSKARANVVWCEVITGD